jgi:hypothetical protein
VQVKLIKRWWNGQHGNVGRLDIELREHDGTWFVVTRVGGADGLTNFGGFPTEDAALEVVDRAMALRPGDWQPLPPVQLDGPGNVGPG